MPCTSKPLDRFALRGYVSLVQWDLDGPFPSVANEQTFANAVMSRSMKLVNLFSSLKVPIDRRSLVSAVETGSIDMLTYLRNDLHMKLDDSFLCTAVRKNRTSMIDHLLGLGLKPCGACLDAAARNGNMKVIKDFHKLGAPFKSNLFTNFIISLSRHGSIEWLEWAIKAGATVDAPSLYVEAAHRGNLHVMKWAKDNSFSIDPKNPRIREDCVEFAIRSNSVDILTWLQENGVEFGKMDSDCWEYAVLAGHLEVLRFGLANGLADPSDKMYSLAILNGQTEIQLELNSINCPVDDLSLAASLEVQNRPLFLRLRDKGAKLSPKCVNAASSIGDIPTIQWLLSISCPFDGAQAMLAACEEGELDTVKFLHGRLGVPFVEVAPVVALHQKHIPMFRYIMSQGMTELSSDSRGDLWDIAIRNHEFVRQLLDFGLECPTVCWLDAISCDLFSLKMAHKYRASGFQMDLLAILDHVRFEEEYLHGLRLTRNWLEGELDRSMGRINNRFAELSDMEPIRSCFPKELIQLKKIPRSDQEDEDDG